ncbi:MAG TPA: beta-ketoacyl-ACP synthase III [Opitutales bacterium]|nr:beta-ketoacyl-ACP synthase III [Opitutales bacterium]
MTNRPSVVVSGTGSYLPAGILTNDDLSQMVETSDEWIVTRTGIRERRIASADETTADMGFVASREAIAAAGLKPEDIDLLIVGTITPDMLFPSTACMLQARLGLRQIPAFDVEAACSGFLYTIDIARAMLQAGTIKHALVVGAEKLSSIVDWTDRSTCVLFGDGAGAVVLSRSDEPGIGMIDSILGSDGNGGDILHMPGGGAALPATEDSVRARQHFLKMNGREVFKIAVRVMEKAILEILEKQGLAPDDVSLFVPHQANIRILEMLATRMKLPLDRFALNIDRLGNTSAASIPIVLDEAFREGRIESGDLVVLVAFGAGLTWGATLIRWQ